LPDFPGRSKSALEQLVGGKRTYKPLKTACDKSLPLQKQCFQPADKLPDFSNSVLIIETAPKKAW